MYIKTLLVITALFIAPHLWAQQKINTFQVIDKNTKQAIPYASVNILKARLSLATYKDGVFVIPGNIAVMQDTIVFNAQLYEPLSLPLNSLANIARVELKKLPALANTPVLKKYHKQETLNDFDEKQVGHYAGMPTENSSFNYLQIAQLFHADSDHNHLLKISVGRMQGMMPTKFRVRIYDVDSLTGGPGKDICDKIIHVDNFDDIEYATTRRVSTKPLIEAKSVNIDLKKAKIVIPVKSFYIAVQWLQHEYNMVNAMVYHSTNNKFGSVTVYRPFVGISAVRGNKLNIWVMNTGYQWIPYDHFYPFGTDLAIKAEVEY